MTELNISMAGIDHSLADLEERERFTFTKTSATAAMRRVTGEFGAAGCVLLFTCNRTELWIAHESQPDRSPYELLCAVRGVAADALAHHFVQREGEEAARHLLTTACGINSRVFGEDQIITQVGEALALAHDCGCAGPVLERMFRTAVTAAKRVKTTVRLGAPEPSVAARMVELLEQGPHDLVDLPCLVIGNGEMGRLAAHALLARGCDVRMTLRRYKHGDVLIPGGCRIIGYDERFQALHSARVVVSATSSPHHTLGYDETLPWLDNTPRIFFDLAVPRDISSRLRQVPGVTLYNIDSMGGGAGARQSPELAHAGALLEDYLEDFKNWYVFRDLLPVVNRTSALAANDLMLRVEKQFRRIEVEEEARAQLEESVRTSAEKVVGKLLYGLRDHLDRALWQDCIQGLACSAGRLPPEFALKAGAKQEDTL